MPSERNFGLTFAGVFAFIGLIKWVLGGDVRWWALGVSALFAAFTFAAPSALRPLNGLWFKLGQLLHRIINPIVLSLLFVAVIVPMSLVMRAMGKKFLTLGFEPDARSYWITRDPAESNPSSIRNQF
ncbi:SxtJ family membrane protein [Aestuariivirga sp.]|uniref:SxtJ family membrane protein n=1 Tax=Aestuariivirga sp. TaxID=2650926 RepID=UPI0039E31A81